MPGPQAPRLFPRRSRHARIVTLPVDGDAGCGAGHRLDLARRRSGLSEEEGVHRSGRRVARHRHDLDAGDAAVARCRRARHHRDRRRRLGQGGHRAHAPHDRADRAREHPGGRGRGLPAHQLARSDHGLGSAVRRVLVQRRVEPTALSRPRRRADATDRSDEPQADRSARRAVHDPADPEVPKRGDALGRRAVHDRGPGPGPRPGDRHAGQGTGADGGRGSTSVKAATTASTAAASSTGGGIRKRPALR